MLFELAIAASLFCFCQEWLYIAHWLEGNAVALIHMAADIKGFILGESHRAELQI